MCRKRYHFKNNVTLITPYIHCGDNCEFFVSILMFNSQNIVLATSLYALGELYYIDSFTWMMQCENSLLNARDMMPLLGS